MVFNSAFKGLNSSFFLVVVVVTVTLLDDHWRTDAM